MNLVTALAEKYRVTVVEARPSVKLGSFSIYGKDPEIAAAKKMLEDNLDADEIAGKTPEGKLRLKVQDLIDKNNITADILYEGNTINSYTKTMQDFERILKGGVNKLTNRLYDFFHLNFTIAHYNKAGWIATYPQLSDVLSVLKRESKPAWRTDVIKIQKAMIEKLEPIAKTEKSNVIKLRK